MGTLAAFDRMRRASRAVRAIAVMILDAIVRIDEWAAGRVEALSEALFGPIEPEPTIAEKLIDSAEPTESESGGAVTRNPGGGRTVLM